MSWATGCPAYIGLDLGSVFRHADSILVNASLLNGPDWVNVFLRAWLNIFNTKVYVFGKWAVDRGVQGWAEACPARPSPILSRPSWARTRLRHSSP